MTTSGPAPTPAPAPKPAALDRRQRRARAVLTGQLRYVHTGRVDLHDVDGTHTTFGDTQARGVTLQVHNPEFYPQVVHGASVGAGSSYVSGDWDSDDLVALLQTVIANRQAMRTLTPSALLRITADLTFHLLRGNRIGRAPANIAAHYDLSNELYAAFLDETMTYSAAYFTEPDLDLADAQRAKYLRLADKARLAPGQHVLEIGCGWGSFALTAARDFGCRVTGITLSQQQADLARRRVAEAGLQDLVDIQLIDYRHIEGTFDRIVSIEMLEAVGHRYLPAYFRVIDRLLATDGIAAIQVITLPGQRERAYRRRPDFIQRFIFPGGHLPSVTSMSRAIDRTRDLALVDVEDIGLHYAETLRRWRLRFAQASDRVNELGFDRSFQRLWHFYLSYCEAAFSMRYLHDFQLVLARPLNRSLGAHPYGGTTIHGLHEPTRHRPQETRP